MVHIIAIITAKPGQRQTFLEAYRANLAAVRAEKGCIEYVPAIDTEGAPPLQTKFGADTIVVVEKWADMDAFKAHLTAPHMATFAAKVKDLLAGRAIHVLSAA